MDREQLIELRPEVFTQDGLETTTLEHFQNSVLRPVIKMQHEFIIQYLKSNQQFHLLIQSRGTRNEFHIRISNFIGKQSDIKNQLIGSIIGMLTSEELNFYSKNQNEINKRIYQMICQRAVDTFY